MSRFDDYIARKKVEFGDKFDASDLAPQFIKYFDSGDRVKVLFSHHETLFGTVSVTTGWKPSFLLMHSVRSIGSPNLLGKNDRVIAVKERNGYRSV